MTGPLQRIRLIEGSLSCFALGAVGLLPLVGMPAVFLAIQEYHRTSAGAGHEWNPARRYLVLGLTLAWMGLALTAGLVGLVGVIIIRINFR